MIVSASRLDRVGSIGKALKAAKTLSPAWAGSVARKSTLDRVFFLCGLVELMGEKLARFVGVEGGDRFKSMLFRIE